MHYRITHKTLINYKGIKEQQDMETSHGPHKDQHYTLCKCLCKIVPLRPLDHRGLEGCCGDSCGSHTLETASRKIHLGTNGRPAAAKRRRRSAKWRSWKPWWLYGVAGEMSFDVSYKRLIYGRLLRKTFDIVMTWWKSNLDRLTVVCRRWKCLLLKVVVVVLFCTF